MVFTPPTSVISVELTPSKEEATEGRRWKLPPEYDGFNTRFARKTGASTLQVGRPLNISADQVKLVDKERGVEYTATGASGNLDWALMRSLDGSEPVELARVKDLLSPSRNRKTREKCMIDVKVNGSTGWSGPLGEFLVKPFLGGSRTFLGPSNEKFRWDNHVYEADEMAECALYRKLTNKTTGKVVATTQRLDKRDGIFQDHPSTAPLYLADSVAPIQDLVVCTVLLMDTLEKLAS